MAKSPAKKSASSSVKKSSSEKTEAVTKPVAELKQEDPYVSKERSLIKMFSSFVVPGSQKVDDETVPVPDDSEEKRKKIIKYSVIGVAVLILLIIILLCAKGCSSSKKEAKNKILAERENTILLAKDFIDQEMFDNAISELNSLLKKDPKDKEAKTLWEEAVQKKKLYDARNSQNGNSGVGNINIDTSGLASGFDSLQQQLEAQTRLNEEQQKLYAEQMALNNKQAKELADMIKRQQERDEAEKALEQEKKAQAEAQAQLAAKEEAERKAKEAEIAKKNADFAKKIDAVNLEIEGAKAKLAAGDLSGALKQFQKAKSLLPEGSTPEEVKLIADKKAQIANILLESSVNGNYGPADNQTLLTQASNYANNSITDDPDNALAHYVLGQKAYKEGNFVEAEKELKLAISADGKNYMYWYYLGLTQFRGNKPTDAVNSFKTSINLYSKYAPAYYALGVSYKSLNKTSDALASFRKAYQTDSNHANAYKEAARIQAASGNYADAINLFNESIRIDPKRTTYNELGSVYEKSGNLKEAEAAYRKSISLLGPSEDDPLTYYNLSSVLLNQGKTNDAVEYAKKSYDSKNKFRTVKQKVDAIYNYALVCQNTMDYENAIPLYQEVITLDPANWKAKLNLGKICLEKGQTDTAISLLSSAYTIQPDIYEINNNLGNAYATIGDYDKSITFLLNALKSQPKNITVKRNLARAYAKTGSWQNAKIYFVEVTDADSSDYDSLIDLANIYIQLGDKESAKRNLNKVISNKPNLRVDEVRQLMSLCE